MILPSLAHSLSTYRGVILMGGCISCYNTESHDSCGCHVCIVPRSLYVKGIFCRFYSSYNRLNFVSFPALHVFTVAVKSRSGAEMICVELLTLY